MRAMTRAFAIAGIGVSVLIAGCGQQSTSASGQPGTGSSSRAAVGCVTPKLTQPGKTFTITEKDTGKAFCIVSGTGVFVFLHGTPTHAWTHIQPSSAGLAPRASGVMMLARGVTGGYFVATRLGTVTLTSTRTPCLVAEKSVSPGGLHCTPGTLFRVTFLVRGKM